MSTPPPIPPGPLILSGRTRDVYDALLDRLIDGRLAPGEVVPITATARSLDVSPTPVREALVRLVERGVVTRHGNREYRAAPLLTVQKQSRLLTARLAVEPVLAQLASRNRSAELMSALERSLDEHRGRVRRGPSFAHDRVASELFHELIAVHSGNEFLHDAYVSLSAHVHRFRALGAGKVSDAAMALTEHERIFDAVVRADDEGAGDAMAAHICGMQERLPTPDA